MNIIFAYIDLNYLIPFNYSNFLKIKILAISSNTTTCDRKNTLIMLQLAD